MRVYPVLFVALLGLLAAGLVAVACGGSGDSREPLDMSAVHTATPPDPLPEAVIVGEVAPTPQDGTAYTIAAGDTLASIADQFGTTVEAISQANDIEDPRQLVVGQVLVIPGGSDGDNEGDDVAASATAEATPGESTEPDGDCTYTVESGDVAHNIAQQFGLTDEEFAALNGTSVDDMRSLSVGDELAVPCSVPEDTPEP